MSCRLFDFPSLLTIGLATMLGTDARAQGPGAHLANQCSPVLVVDLKAGLIGGVHVDTTMEALVAALGADHVVGQDRLAEGQEGKAYAVDICGHRIGRDWTGVAITDTVFRTLEGVGPGSPVAAFDSAYGKAQISMEEGMSLRYDVRSAGVNLIIEVEDSCYRFDGGRAMGVAPACRATRMWFPLHHVLDD